MPTLYVTAPPDGADDLARELVERRLAACVNRVGCDSVYRWDGAVRDEPEVILFVKTTAELAGRCREWIEANHPYDVPCVERFDEDGVLPAFADWRAEAVEADRDADG